jgi:hypothetical protein
VAKMIAPANRFGARDAAGRSLKEKRKGRIYG